MGPKENPGELTARALRSVALPDICTDEDLSRVVGIPLPLVRRHLREGRLPGRRCGRRWLVSRRALLGWLEQPEPDAGQRPVLRWPSEREVGADERPFPGGHHMMRTATPEAEGTDES